MAQTQATETKKPSTPPSKKRLRREGKKKLMGKIYGDKEFSTKYFEAKSKRSTDKKALFRKKKSKKK
jgi:hypothetical protein